MPIHDWTRVDANLFHDFRQTWTIGIRNRLNGGLLPNGFSALVEQHAGGLVPDVIALQSTRFSPDDQLVGGAVVVDAPPSARLVRRAEQEHSAARANRIVIRHALGQVVSIIEVVSPGNKSSRSALRSFIAKTTEFLRQGVNVLVVDLFPPSVRDPQGIHKAIWDEFQDEPFSLPADKPLTLAAYVADFPKVAYLDFVGVGDSLPAMPAYIRPDAFVPVPLEATYQDTWATCPAEMRELVESGGAAPASGSM